MPLIRDYTDSLLVDRLSDKAEILFARLLTKLDGNGNFTADPQLLKAALFPRKQYRISDIASWTKELSILHVIDPSKKPTSLIRLYNVAGKNYLHMRNYGQKLKWKKSLYPPPPEVEDETEVEGEENLNIPEGEKTFFKVGNELYWGTVSEWFKKKFQIFLEPWEMQNGKDKVARIFVILDSEYAGYQFNDDNHVQRTFIAISKRKEQYGTKTNQGINPGKGGYSERF